MAKKKFEVRWAETVYYRVKVEADSEKEVEDMWNNGEIHEEKEAEQTEYLDNSLEIEKIK